MVWMISAMESCSLLNPTLQSTEGVLSSFRTTWQEFVEDDGFWRVLLLMVVIALLSLGIAYYVSRVLPFSGWRGGSKIGQIWGVHDLQLSCGQILPPELLISAASSE